MKFIIRDDDACAFTRVEELEACYGEYLGRLPVCLSVTPFRIPGNDKTLPDELRGQTDILPLADNKELVDYIRSAIEAGQVEIALHGYHHARTHGQPEYIAGSDLARKTVEGKEYLEGVLGCSVDTFVPPNNGIAASGMAALVEANLNLVGLPPFVRPGYRVYDKQTFANYVKVKWYSVVHRMRYPHVLQYSGHQEVDYYSVTPQQHLEYLLDAFEKCRRMNGIFVFATHYHAFDRRLASGQRIRDVLKFFVDLVEKYEDVHPVGYRDFWAEA